MSSRMLTAVLAAALFAWGAGCSSDGIPVTTSFDPVATFPSQATFVWDDAASRLPSDERLQELDLDAMIKQAANDAFAARGYRHVDAEPADFRLSYELGENIWRGPDGTRSVASISLVLRRASSDQRLWVGFGRADVQPSVSRDHRARRLREAFDAMLEEFPPSSR